MFLVVSKDKRIPHDLKNFEYETWPLEEFIEKASSDEGISISPEGGIYFNIDCLDQVLYEALKQYSDYHIRIVYYKFSDQNVQLNFKMDEEIIIYEDETKEEIKKEEPVTEQKIEEEKPKEEPVEEPKEEKQDSKYNMPEGVNVITDTDEDSLEKGLDVNVISNMLSIDDFDVQKKSKDKPGKVILFGSSKGGTGKTFTCLITAYRYAQAHPYQKVALADFDIIDGQIGITINKVAPTMADFYKQQKAGYGTFQYLENCKVKNDHFSPNIDFYLAPPMDVPELTENIDFWSKVFELLITNYDVVFFDSGIDYLGKKPISMLYKIADKIIITCNPSINSVKSIMRQLKTLSGIRKNDVYSVENKIIDKVNIVLTRVYADHEINDIVVMNLTKFAPVVAAFGNIDDLVSKVQWYQQWELISRNKKITDYLDKIASLDE